MGLFVLTCIIEVLFPLSFVMTSHVSPHVCCTQLAGTFSMADTLQAEAAEHNGAADMGIEVALGIAAVFVVATKWIRTADPSSSLYTSTIPGQNSPVYLFNRLFTYFCFAKKIILGHQG